MSGTRVPLRVVVPITRLRGIFRGMGRRSEAELDREADLDNQVARALVRRAARMSERELLEWLAGILGDIARARAEHQRQRRLAGRKR